MDAADPIGEGRYRLVELLGHGGMAAVYRAWDEHLKAWRAVKVLTGRSEKSKSVRSRFEDEARAMARLQHPNIVTVHEFGVDEDRPFIVMELVAGGSLADIMGAEGPLHPKLACTTMATVLDALQFAHENEVVHRDIKPANILLSAAGHPLVGDFGIARIGGELESSRTRTGAMMGTLAYMAPEQRANARRVDGRADIFAVGNTLYALVTGEEPFDLFSAPDDDEGFAKVPEPLRPALRQATAHKPDERFATAAEMAQALRKVAPELEGHSTGVSSFPATSEWDTTPPPTASPNTPAPQKPTSETFAVNLDAPSTSRSRWPWLAGLAAVSVLGLLCAGMAGVVGGGTLVGGGLLITDSTDVGTRDMDVPSKSFSDPQGPVLTPELARRAIRRSIEGGAGSEALRACATDAGTGLSAEVWVDAVLHSEGNSLQWSIVGAPEDGFRECIAQALNALPGPHLQPGPALGLDLPMAFDGAGFELRGVLTRPRVSLEPSAPWHAVFRKPAPGADGTVTLVEQSVARNQITDTREWFENHNLQVPGQMITFSSDLPGDPPAEFPDISGLGQPDKVARDGDAPIALFEHALVVFDERGEPDVKVDLGLLSRSPRTLKGDEDFIDQEVGWATVKQGVLYVSTGHRTYAKSSYGDNAYITAFDLATGDLYWRSPPLVSNAANFVLDGGVILSGYGFTAEPDALFVLDRARGEVLSKVPVASGPDWLIPEADQLYVRTYNRDYVFRIER